MPLITPKGVLTFPTLFKPRAQAEGAEPRYSVNILFDPAAQKSAEYAALKAAVKAAVVKTWGQDKFNDRVFMGRLRSPFRDAAEKQYEGYQAGWIFISAWSKQQPGVVDGRLQDMTESEVWSGQIGRLEVNPFTYQQQGNIGVSFGLNNVQITKPDAPRLDGRKQASAVFATDDADMATAGADDSPF